jgi:phospholipid/cholesterol/gamma-HCH transport system substrate-binding protein
MSDVTANQERPEADSSGPVKTRRTNVGGKSFSSRNPTPIGAIGLVLIVVILWAAFNAGKLPLIGGGTAYSAYFTEAAGLTAGNEVRIAGVKVGEVDSVGLSYAGGQGKVKVVFKVKNAYIGDESQAAIKLKTLLGAKYLSIDSTGMSKQDPHKTIPESRTTSPFDVYPAFTELTTTVNDIDTAQLAKAFDTLSADFANTPSSVKTVVDGLSRLSNTIASRDTALRQLLAKANDVTGVLASRDAQLQQLLSDGGLLLDELNARRDAIHSLLVNTSTLATQLEGLVTDNQKTIGPLLDGLQTVLKTLNDNQTSLDQGLALLGPFYRVFNNTIGNGRWFDNYICNVNAIGIVGLLAGQLPNGGCS